MQINENKLNEAIKRKSIKVITKICGATRTKSLKIISDIATRTKS